MAGGKGHVDAAAGVVSQSTTLSTQFLSTLWPWPTEHPFSSPAHYQGPVPSRSQDNILTSSSAAIKRVESHAFKFHPQGCA